MVSAPQFNFQFFITLCFTNVNYKRSIYKYTVTIMHSDGMTIRDILVPEYNINN